MGTAWSSLAYFQSFDLIQREYKEHHHGRKKLSEARTWEIISSFTQSQEYYHSATSASEYVKPLLLYYSVLSACRALILFMDGIAEAALKPSHGLEVYKWRDVLSSTSGNILDLQVKMTAGTFQSLATATQNMVLQIMKESNDGICVSIHTPQIGFSEEETKTLVFGDIVAREPKLRTLYKETTGSDPCTYDGDLTRSHIGVGVHLMPSMGLYELSEAKIKDAFNLPDSVDITARRIPNDPFPHFHFFLPHDRQGVPSYLCPVIEAAKAPQGFLFTPWPNGGYLSPLLRCFATSYVLGMLVRYHPSKWLAILRGRKGDALLPLLRAATSMVEEDFPAILRGQFRSFAR